MPSSLRETEEAQACEYFGALLSALKVEGLDVTADVSTATGPVADAIVEFAHKTGDITANWEQRMRRGGGR